MMDESPYIVTRSEGMVHLRLRSNPKDCIGCCRLDVYEIIVQMTKSEALAEVRAGILSGSTWCCVTIQPMRKVAT